MDLKAKGFPEEEGPAEVTSSGYETAELRVRGHQSQSLEEANTPQNE